ncbi:MAG: heparinase II/III family protein [Bacteroidales bacterium]|nr:heparinase II/III family protein [Bacteroidales bacterium]
MRKILLIALVAVLASCTASQSDPKGNHPCLLLTKEGVKNIKAAKGKMPMLDVSLERLAQDAQAAMDRETCVPVPKDGGGGYTHETHKLNYYDLHVLGMSWQLSGDKKYVEKAKEIFLAYCEMYPTIGMHPIEMSPVRGMLFWQTLNESVWLVHVAMAYDCLKDQFTQDERDQIENKLLRPIAKFIMEGTPANVETFNKMHNHGTWATAAVGMAGIAMDDEELYKKALYGSDMTGENGGFVMQLDNLFSPDGYFTEGAYYHRYAIWPFVAFAQCIDHHSPELGIFAYRDSVILRSVNTLAQETYCGEFMHFNDALEKGFSAQELIYAIDIAYNADRSNKMLLTIADTYQHRVMISDAGYWVAKGLSDGEAQPIKYSSVLLKDGPEGKDGAVAIIRSEDGNSALTMKATSHGLSHGHYDKLTFAYYDAGLEIVSDYGASRFLNIEQKNKGHYTKENKTYAGQTVAHNTLVADRTSHYNGDIKISSEHSPRIAACSMDNQAFQYVSAVDSTAYDGIRMQRWLAWVELPFLQFPLIVDLLKAESSQAHEYDFPLHYNGHMVHLSVPYKRATQTMSALGDKMGYQHLWVEAEADCAEGTTTYSWLSGYRMYSFSQATTANTKFRILRSGASDPNFNLRSEPSIMFSEKCSGDRLFASCLETHGKYDLQVEQAANLTPSCVSVEVVKDDAHTLQVDYHFVDGQVLSVRVERSTSKMTINY